MSVWQKELQGAFRDAKALLAYLDLAHLSPSIKANQQFPTMVSKSFANRMIKGDANCPLLLQVLPIEQENENVDGFSLHPLEEASFSPQRGLLHKYQSRALITLSGGCAINCRYCFRRHYPYQTEIPSKENILAIKAYLENHPEINEIILSGGDPLLANNERLAFLLEQIVTIKNIKTLRFHSRIPIVLPSRIEDEFIALMQALPLKKVMVIHSNHANELNDEVFLAANKMKKAFDVLLNQSVLLKGVNDDAMILKALSERLFEIGVMPYYLHSLDKVKGASHFEVSETKARQIFCDLQTLLPGYLVPKWAKEVPGKKHKVLLF